MNVTKRELEDYALQLGIAIYHRENYQRNLTWWEWFKGAFGIYSDNYYMYLEYKKKEENLKNFFVSLGAEI